MFMPTDIRPKPLPDVPREIRVKIEIRDARGVLHVIDGPWHEIPALMDLEKAARFAAASVAENLG